MFKRFNRKKFQKDIYTKCSVFASRRWDLGSSQQGSVRKTNCTRRFKQTALHSGRSVLAMLVEEWREDGAVSLVTPALVSLLLLLSICPELCVWTIKADPCIFLSAATYHGLVGMVNVSTSSQIPVGILHHSLKTIQGTLGKGVWEVAPGP